MSSAKDTLFKEPLKGSSSLKDKFVPATHDDDGDPLLGAGQASMSPKDAVTSSILGEAKQPAKRHKTAAEQAFERARLRRMAAAAAKGKPSTALKTHREKVAAYNERLAKQSDHYDVPKIGPG